MTRLPWPDRAARLLTAVAGFYFVGRIAFDLWGR
jgi:hypothetical protein